MADKEIRRGKNGWLAITLFNLVVVALLGALLRSKSLFPLKFLNYKYILNAHSNFAFSGWLTLVIFVLLVYEILPKEIAEKLIYQWLFGGVFICALGMLLSFSFQGYSFYSILFSTLFILVTYVFCYVFIKDILAVRPGKAVIILVVSAVLCLALSSLGAFNIVYLLRSHSKDTFLYQDSVYTYLHMQYNGFFSLSVFGLMVNKYVLNIKNDIQKKSVRFARMAVIAVLPTMFLTFLWHYPNPFVRIVASVGWICLLISLFLLIGLLRSLKEQLLSLPGIIKILLLFSVLSFGIKVIMQGGLAISAVGDLVFSDRPIIIGYLHLVLLGFVSLYLLSHIFVSELGNGKNRFTKNAILVFLFAVIINEVILITQGICAFFVFGSSIFQWLLWGAAICLFIGALLMFVSFIKSRDRLV